MCGAPIMCLQACNAALDFRRTHREAVAEQICRQVKLKHWLPKSLDEEANAKPMNLNPASGHKPFAVLSPS